MDKLTLDQVASDLEEISARYGARFAGQPRQTRPLSMIDELLERSAALLTRLQEMPADVRGTPRYQEVLSVAQDNLKLYRDERAAIAEAKAAGPDFEEASRVATLANFVFARYFRHFAGQARPTRDLGLLDEMIDDLKHYRRRLGDLAGRNSAMGIQRDRKVVADNLSMYESERQEIIKAQYSGTAEEQAGALATIANEQFRLYAAHFAGQQRLTRRPQLLQRMINNLKQVRERMMELKRRGLKVDFNDQNIGVVERNLKMYEGELAEIRKERQRVPLVDLMGYLGEAANAIFDEYRTGFANKNRATVNLAVLGDICDRLGEIARQMNDMQRTEQNAVNADNLALVMDYLSSFEREYELIKQTQANPEQARPAPTT